MEDVGALRRHAVLSLGIALTRTEDGDSPRPGLDVLEEAPEQASKVAEVLSKFRYTPYQAGAPDGPADRGRLVEEAVVAEDVGVLIVHIVGHGELAEDRSEKLYVLDSDGKRLSRPVSGWIDLIEDHPEQHRPLTLFVLDVCNAGEAAVTAWHARMEVGERRAWVLAATGHKDRAFDYRLSKALVQVLEKYLDRGSRFDPSVRYIPPPTVWRDVERAVKELAQQAGGLEQKIQTSRVPAHEDLSQLPFFPNPSYAPGKGPVARLAGLPPEIARLADWAGDPQHFVLRASGAEPVDRHWAPGYFSGRTAQLDTLARWLDEERAGPGVRIVTGKPGVGKSALLGILVCAAHPALRQPTESLWTRLDDDAPGRNDRIAVVHTRRLSLADIVTSLARQLRHIHAPDGRPDPGDTRTETTGKPADYLMSLLPDDGQPVTVIIDALDEALQPRDITTALLLPLARQAQRPGSPLRLLVGTRDDERFHALLALARNAGGCTDLSAIAPDSIRRDVTSYLKRVLAPDGPYAGATQRPLRDALAEAIAETLTEEGQDSGPAQNPLQWGEFLTAGLYAHYLLQMPAPSTPQEAARRGRAVPRSLPEVLELDLQRHTAQPLLRPVLTALAFAQGRGIPESLLAHAAAAFTAPSDSAHPLSLPDLYALLDGEARFYLRRDVDDDGTTLYRLFHEGLADWLRDPASQPPAQDTPATAESPLKSAARLYERLLDSVPLDALDRRQWHLATPYLLRHTAQHAISAGRLDELLIDGGYLQHADPRTLADALQYAHSDQARLNAAVYRASWGIHHALPPAARRQLLAVDAARFRNKRLQAELPGDTDWQVRWATGSQVSTALARTLTGHTGPVYAVAVVELGGRPHAITGGYDESVRVWDLTTGIQTLNLTGHTGDVRAVAVAEVDGRPHAITGGAGGLVLVWDLTTGIQTLNLTGHTGDVQAVAVAEVDGRPHAITGGYDELVRVWDLTTGTQTCTLTLTGHIGPVCALAVAEVDGRPHAIIEGDEREVLVWDLTAGTQTYTHTRTFTSRPMSVDAMAVTELDGRPHAITGDRGGGLRVWELSIGTHTRTFTGHTGPVHAVAVVGLDGRPHAITGGGDREVRVWDLTTGTHTHTRTLTGPTGWMDGLAVVVAVAELDGRPHAITSGDFDGAVRLWDLTTGTQPRTLTYPSGMMNADAVAVAELDGRPHAMTSHADGGVLVWDLTTGTQTHTLSGLMAAHAVAMAVVELDGRPHTIAGSDDGMQMWDLTTGTRTRTLIGHTRSVYAMAVAELGGRPHAITGGYDESVRVWDLTTGIQTLNLTGHTGDVQAVAVAEVDGRPHAITGDSDGGLRVWDLTTGIQTLTLTGHTKGVRAVAVVELGGRPHAITGGYDELVRVWDLTTGTCLTTFHCPAPVTALAVTPAATVVVAFGQELAVLDLEPLKGRFR
ncbi:hypothetical protein HLK59_16190 [Streptomyces sp. S3(2020)]|uniref:NACHT and WD repeat domain-containing protein n=1 Tax=Streptomyces sp. S3(2020) TaxID=2732044 RepID=UPI001489D170|nr:hypothetical protein [Streptomyces sp. S3(2020)]NNN31879.1 hypothetical protein [Streptomyces sp. S3(2020)]